MKSGAVDPYCFPGTNVLRNLRGILDRSELERFESLAASLAGQALYRNPPLIMDLNYLKSIHRTLFGQKSIPGLAKRAATSVV